MKNLLLFLLVVITYTSCTSDDEIANTDATPLLQKVIFNVGSTPSVQRVWNFNSDGLLSQVTNGNGTVLYTFTYNAESQVSTATVLNNNGTNSTYTFTYAPNGTISHLNNIAPGFDSTLNAFYFGDLTSNYRAFQLNLDGLMTYNKSEFIEIENGISYPFLISQAYASYVNGNLTGQSFHNGTSNGFLHDDNINPLHFASIAVFRALAVTDRNKEWLNSFAVSSNNVIRKNYAVEYGIHEEYTYQLNDNNLPVSATLHFYTGSNLDFSTLKTLYYYQGDIIP